MILLARVLLYFFSSCISSLSPKSGSNHGRTFAGSLLFSFVAKYPTNFHGKDRTGQHWAQGWFFILFKSRFQDVDNKEINQISFIKCCRCVQKIVGQCNLFELMVAISDLTPTSSSSASKNTKTKSTNKWREYKHFNFRFWISHQFLLHTNWKEKHFHSQLDMIGR